MENLNFNSIKTQLQEIKNSLTHLNKFYNNLITGEELYQQILKLTPTILQQNPEAYIEYLNQINKPQKFGSWTLPKHSSGSFYTSFTNLDFLYYSNLTPEEIEILIQFFKTN